MKNHYLVITTGPIVLVCNLSPLQNGIPIDCRAYVVAAKSKEEAKTKARELFQLGADSHAHAWKNN